MLKFLSHLCLIIFASMSTIVTLASANPDDSRSRISFALQSKVRERNLLTTLTILYPKGVTPTLSKLATPNRLVLDFPALSTRRNRQFSLPENSPFSSIRSGVHPDKVRMVLDLRAQNQTEYETQLTDGAIKIIFEDAVDTLNTKNELASYAATIRVLNSKPGEKAEILSAKVPAELIQPLAAEFKPPTVKRISSISLDTDSAPALSISLVRRLPAAPPETQTTATEPDIKARLIESAPEEIAPPIIPSEPALMTISFSFDKESADALVHFLLSTNTNYTLSKNNGRSYTLQLPGLILSGQHLALPYFPPREFEGLESVYPQATAQGVEIEINVEEGVRLTAFARGKEILVRLVR